MLLTKESSFLRGAGGGAIGLVCCMRDSNRGSKSVLEDLPFFREGKVKRSFLWVPTVSPASYSTVKKFSMLKML